MLILGSFKVWVEMEGAPGVRLLLSPLGTDDEQRFVAETTRRVRDANGAFDIQRDYTRYAQLVGAHCVHGWEGVTDAQGHPVAFSAEARDQLLRLVPVQTFVLREVPALGIARAQLVLDAGNASAASLPGSATAAPAQ